VGSIFGVQNVQGIPNRAFGGKFYVLHFGGQIWLQSNSIAILLQRPVYCYWRADFQGQGATLVTPDNLKYSLPTILPCSGQILQMQVIFFPSYAMATQKVRNACKKAMEEKIVASLQLCLLGTQSLGAKITWELIMCLLLPKVAIVTHCFAKNMLCCYYKLSLDNKSILKSTKAKVEKSIL
jgi:hypothetical protein